MFLGKVRYVQYFQDYFTPIQKFLFNISAKVHKTIIIILFLFSTEKSLSAEYYLKYDLFGGGFHLYSINFVNNSNNNTYSVNADIETMGLLNTLSKSQTFIKAEGSVNDDLVNSDYYEYIYNSSKKNKNTIIRFKKNSIPEVFIEPTYYIGNKYSPISKDELINTIDPLTGLYILLLQDNKDLCNEELKIFDGKKRYNIKSQYLSLDNINENKYSGKAYICSLRYEKVGGFKKKDLTNNKDRNINIEILYASLDQGRTFVPIKFISDIKYGSLVMHLSDYSIN